jgi:hypothetical protein
MKRLLQLVTVVLMLSVGGTPLLASAVYGARPCGQRTMACCRGGGGMAAMGMRGCPEDAARMAARQCPGGCCAVSARLAALLPATGRAFAGRTLAATPAAWREDLRRPVAAPPSGRRLPPGRARCVLFCELRI